MATIKLGFAPTRRSIFSAPDALKYAGLTKERLRELNVEFVDIHCVRDGDNYRFGQVVYNTGSSAGGVGPHGACKDLSFEPYEDLEMCECWIQFIDGKWRVGKEASIRSNDAYRRLLE